MDPNHSSPLKFGEGASEHIGRFRGNLGAWLADVKANPAAFWEPQPVRITAYVLLGIAILVAARMLIVGFAPKADVPTDPETLEATLFVACTNRGCNHNYMTKQPRDGVQWPLVCTKCAQKGVYRAAQCKSCRAWYAKLPGSAPGCPFCEERAAAAKAAASKPASTKPKNAHDDEDGW